MGKLLLGDAEQLEVTDYGRKFAIRGTITGPNGRAVRVASIWIILSGEDVPRFIAAYPEDQVMNIKELDTVVMKSDMPKHRLRAGDVGAVVHVHSPEAFEVEFVTADGRTQAVVMLDSDQVRPVGPKDILAVRQLDAA